MIILLGPDNSGKSTLAQNLVIRSLGTDRPLTSFKAGAATGYKEYIELLRGPKSNPVDLQTYRPGLAISMEGAVVCDRMFYCEIPYSRVLRRQERIQWSLKQWHNMHLSALSFNPVVVLATRRSSRYEDSVPEALFEPILEEYRKTLKVHDIQYLEYDFQHEDSNEESDFPGMLLDREKTANDSIKWWLESPELYGVGNTVDPTVLIMAQDLGPSNVHRIPFEQGPSGYYLSELLDSVGAPLNSFYLTNWIKDPDPSRNASLFRKELTSLRPTHVILLGKSAEASLSILDDYVAHSNVHSIVHPGWVVNHAGTIPEMKRRKEKFWEEWVRAWDKIALALQ